MSRKSLAVLLASSALALALSGCAGSPAAVEAAATPKPSPTVKPQTVVEACAILEKSIDTTAMSSAFGDIQSNPDTAIAKINTVLTSLSAALTKVTNADVLAVATPARDDFAKMISAITALETDKTATQQLLDSTKAVQSSFKAMGTVCT